MSNLASSSSSNSSGTSSSSGSIQLTDGTETTIADAGAAFWDEITAGPVGMPPPGITIDTGATPSILTPITPSPEPHMRTVGAGGREGTHRESTVLRCDEGMAQPALDVQRVATPALTLRTIHIFAGQ
jgi:hypothetical protein